MAIKVREQKMMTAVKTGLILNILLSILKTSVGVVGHSPALLADGVLYIGYGILFGGDCLYALRWEATR